METVRLLEEHEFSPEVQKYFEGTKTWFNVDYIPMREVRRLGLSEPGVMEVIQVVQLFSCYTKIADGLQLEPDFTPWLHTV